METVAQADRFVSDRLSRRSLVSLSKSRSAGMLVATCSFLPAARSGALASLGTLPMLNNAPSWATSYSGCGDAGTTLLFQCDSPNFRLSGAGPLTFYSVSAAPTTCSPFLWQGSGTATGRDP